MAAASSGWRARVLGPGRIFISYRREETAFPAGWLYDRLAEHFGDGQVFKAVNSIELGDDFVEEISSAVGSCEVLLVLIGHQWLTITDEDGQRRLDDPNDFVRVEIAAALARNVRVIPILVEGARMRSGRRRRLKRRRTPAPPSYRRHRNTRSRPHLRQRQRPGSPRLPLHRPRSLAAGTGAAHTTAKA